MGKCGQNSANAICGDLDTYVPLAGFSLTCKLCTGVDFSSCTGETTQCAANQACGGVRTASIANGVTVSEIYVLSCVTNEKCNTNASLSTPSSKIKLATSCCYMDNCTPSTPTLAADSSQPNGLTCRTCLSAYSDYCYTGDTIGCNGDENMCILQRTNIINAQIKQSVAIRGCATKSYCSIGSNSTSNGNLEVNVVITCSNGAFGLRSSPFVAFIVAIVMAKVFLLK
ncbi:phospholipase A2 inhibitor and Ly6/PLAUR domain-containing protein-like [Pseudophryne corroboree]|uniref:phospholipase A2 inhibitor and Ly6/PLAUR domain-containing protein-like n=1 Tax=Pseudophryne corroboree TaxID=495146 RepID=UPI00308196F0